MYIIITACLGMGGDTEDLDKFVGGIIHYNVSDICLAVYVMLFLLPVYTGFC